MIFDIKKLQANRQWAKDNMQGHDFLFERAAEILSDNLNDIARDPQDILIIGERGYDFLKDRLLNKNINLFDVSQQKNEIPIFEKNQFDCYF